MRLSEFIHGNLERILVEWEAFARTLDEGRTMGRLELRDHAADILRAAAAEMNADQTPREQVEKSHGDDEKSVEAVRLNAASTRHAVERVEAGFNVVSVVAEYRSLRASVLRLWRAGGAGYTPDEVQDLTRFNEAMDQSLAKAVEGYTKRVDATRTMFLAILGHDLRNPLSAISMATQVLPLVCAGNEQVIKLASGIQRSTKSMATMISDLLDYTSTGLGVKMPVSREKMDMGVLGAAVVEEIRLAHPTRRVEFQAIGDLTGEWDEGRIRQLMTNLLGNAIQHGSADGPVKLGIGTEASVVLVTVANHGAPIPEATQRTMFDPLVRGSPEQEKQRSSGNLGLGLYIAREVVFAHGGTIDVTSTAEAGTVFTARLPRHAVTGVDKSPDVLATAAVAELKA